MAWQRYWGDDKYSAEEWKNYKQNNQDSHWKRQSGWRWERHSQGIMSDSDLKKLAGIMAKKESGNSGASSEDTEGYQAVTKKGQWECPECGTKNNKGKTNCRHCSVLRPAEVPKAGEAALGAAAPGAKAKEGAAQSATQVADKAQVKQEASSQQASQSKSLPARIMEVEKLLKAMDSVEDAEDSREALQSKLQGLQEQHKKETEAAMQERPVLSRLHAAQAKVERLTKQAAEQDVKVKQLQEQLEEARMERAKVGDDLVEAQEEVHKVAKEFQGDTKPRDEAMMVDSDAKYQEAMQQLRTIKDQANRKAVANGRWLLHAKLEQTCELGILEQVLQDFPPIPRRWRRSCR